MPDNFNLLMSTPERRYALQLGHSIRMITRITQTYDDAVDSNQVTCANAMVDAFYVHVRLLADFLVKKTKDMDFGPEDFGIEWEIPLISSAQNLGEYWEVASKYVVHFGHRRVPEALEDLEIFQIGTAAFRAMGADAIRVFAIFLRKLQEVTPEWSMDSWVPDPVQDPKDWNARNLAGRTAMLRTLFIDACEVFGLDPNELLAKADT